MVCTLDDSESGGCCCSLEFTSSYSNSGTVYARERGQGPLLPREASNLIIAFCLIPIIPDYKYLSFPIDAIIKELYLSLRKYQINDKLGI